MLFERTLHKVIAKIQTLLGNRVKYKTDIVFVWMIFEKFNCGLTSSKHRRDKYDPKIYWINVLTAISTLLETNLCEWRIDEIFTNFQLFKLL